MAGPDPAGQLAQQALADAALVVNGAQQRSNGARLALLALSLLASALFCATAWLTWRQALGSRRTSLQLAREHTMFKTLFNGTSDAVLLLHNDTIIDCNHAALQLFGAASALALSCSGLSQLQPPRQADGSASHSGWQAKLAHAKAHWPARFEWGFKSLAGRHFTAEVSLSGAGLDGDTILQLTVRDISERKGTERSMRLANQAFENSLEGIAITDANRNILTVNRAFTTITGYRADEVIGKNPRLLNSGRQGPEFYSAMWAALDAHQQWQGEIWNIRKDGRVYPQWLNISQVRDEHGQTSNYVGVFSDITELKEAHARNLHAVYHDQLTALPNSVLFKDRLSQLFAQAARSGETLALLFIDVDRLKVVNDSLGRAAGDRLLQQVAERLAACIRVGDTLARMNGDEFAVLLPQLGSVDEAGAIAQHILRSFEGPFHLQQDMVHVSLSIGISVTPTDGSDGETLLQHAAMAMYRAKKSGGIGVELFDRSLAQQASARLALETGLRQALQRNELEVYYQPQLDCVSGQLIGFEALLRWHHPELGMIAPGAFLAIAEETGAIVPIGAWVLQTACTQAQAWRNAHGAPRLIAVNLSARQLAHPDIVKQVVAALDASGLPANCLELEITESMMMHDIDASIGVMQQLAALGVEFSIDDFGTGYSSLAYLKKMPIKALKIDQSFIRDIVTDADGASIVGAIIAMSDTLGLRVVAEGIEDADQLAHLQGYRDIVGQGYLLGRPGAAHTAGALVAAARSPAQLEPSLP